MPEHSTHDGETLEEMNCTCGKACISCQAEKLCVTSGCTMEAKQYEYNLQPKVSHAEHDKKSAAQQKQTSETHAGHNTNSKLSHHDHETAMTDPRMAKAMEADMRRRFFIALILSVPVFLYSAVGTNVLGLNLPTPISANWIMLILTTPIVFWAGSIFITGTFYSLKAKKLNMAVLVATGVLAAYLFSVLIVFVGGETFFEAAALIVTFVLFGHWMEMRSRRGTSDALRALFDLVPPQATVIRDGKEIAVSSAEVIVGDIIILKPGDKVPVDGEIVLGSTTIDEALVTGESMPASKKEGDKVIGGSVNLTGAVQFKATKVGADTVLAQIISLVEKAQNSKAPGQRIADKAAAWLVILAISSGIVTFLAWYFLGNVAMITALTFAISAIVIACPDALGLATPTAVAVGTGIGAKNNILIKDAATLENTARITAIVLDKTGTLTEGKPVVTDVLAYNGFTQNDVLRIQATVEASSNHPIAKAIVQRATDDKIVADALSEFVSVAGYGITAKVASKSVLVGKAQLLEERKVETKEATAILEKLGSEGKTVSLLAVEGKLAGIIAVADKIKPSAAKTVAALIALNIEPVMITGDNKRVAEAVAKEIGISRFYAEVLPKDKANYVKQLQDEGKFVAMVGDGINDAPALAQANIGIAIGAGTDVAIETASIVLMKSDPFDIVKAIKLSSATVRKMKQNLFWAVIYNVLAIPIAAGAFYTAFGWSLRPEVAAILMSVSSIVVALNAVSLKAIDKKLGTMA